MSSVRLAALAALVGWAALAGAAAHAQVFRIVGPDGRVTFSDKPPPDGKATAAPTVSMSGGGGSPLASLPAELRTAATRFPVVLYTAPECPPCLTARGYLVTKGIPYTEKTVTSAEDIAALQRLAGDTRLPLLTIGAQHVRGFSDVEWPAYFDAAGYPKTSQLPASYRNPAATPLVAAAAPAPAARPQQAPAEAPSVTSGPRPSDPSPSNPAGIRF